jgi:hypothetical protein
VRFGIQSTGTFGKPEQVETNRSIQTMAFSAFIGKVKLSIFDVEFRSAWPDSRQCDYKPCQAISIFWKFTQTQMTKKSFIEAGNFQFI